MERLLLTMWLLTPLIDDFFARCYVMTDDKVVRENRLGLLQAITHLSDGIMDLTKLEGF